VSLKHDPCLPGETNTAVVGLHSGSHSVPLSSVTGKLLSTESDTGLFMISTGLGGDTRILGASMTVGGEENVYTWL